ncbi:MAG: hypothetical protein JST82_13915 [Bacteroidetes bacterium]|nr:hypothetical protein [Bacteroidota bacterium]
MHSDKAKALELYRSLSALQPKYQDLYTDLHKQYQSCQCYACKVRLITFGIELVNLNAYVSHLETTLLPPISGVLDKLNINYTILNDLIMILG